MNGEIFQICSIVTAAKQALKSQTLINYEPEDNVTDIKFGFAPTKEGEQPEIMDGVDAWFSRCMYNGIEDIKYVVLPPTDAMRKAGNARSINCLVCFYPNNKVVFWKPNWGQIKESKKWIVMYTETIMANPPQGKPVIKFEAAELKKAIEEMMDFAVKIDFDELKDQYLRSITMLEGNFDYQEEDKKVIEMLSNQGREIKKINHLDLPKKYMDIFEAAGNADTVTAMGVMGNKAPSKAKDLGLEEEFKKRISTLYNQIIKAFMYAVNEW